MYFHTERCSKTPQHCFKKCIEEGYTDNSSFTYQDQEECPFFFVCHCECPGLKSSECWKQCKKQGKYQVMINTSPSCSTCECVCEKINCNTECQGEQFQIFNNSNGCQTCNCTCPILDCITQCGDLYGIGHDDFGCDVCLCKKSRY